MKIKKLVASALAGMMVLSSVACGGTSGGTNSGNAGEGSTAKANQSASGNQGTGGEKIKVWTLAADLEQFAERYQEQTGREVEVTVIAPADYSTKLTAAFGAKSTEVDIIVGEPQMLPNFFEAGFFEDLSQAPYEAEQYRETIVDYIFEAGKDANGTIRALSYQVTPGSMIYRRDIAKAIWGNDDPEFIGQKFANFDTILETAVEVKEAGYRIFTDSGNLRWYANASAPWVVDNKLQISESRLAYMDAAVRLYQEDLVAFAPEWSAAWYASMAGQLPINAGWSALDELEDAQMTEVFAYSLPSWGALIIRDNAGDNKGNFGITSGPSSYFGGGTFLGISTYSKNKSAAWDFIKFCTLSEETAQWWLDVSNGDVVSNVKVLSENADYMNESFGNQKTYEFYTKEAINIDYSLVTKYDDQLGNFWGSAIESIQKGDMTKEEALEDFYIEVGATYPDIEIVK